MQRYLYLNTRDRSEGSNADAVFYVQFNDFPDSFLLTVESIQFPHQMYPFSIERDNFIVYLDENPAVVAIPLEIGTDYNGFTLATELQAKFNSFSPNGYTYTVTYDTLSMKLTVSEAGNNAWRLVDGQSSALSELGYDDISGLYNVSPYTFTAPVDLSGTKYVDISTEFAGGFNYNSTGSYNTLARIPTRESFGEVVLYNPKFPHNIETTNSNFSLRLSLRDDRGRLVQLHENGNVSYAFRMDSTGQE